MNPIEYSKQAGSAFPEVTSVLKRGPIVVDGRPAQRYLKY
jgi:hypothetical protein